MATYDTSSQAYKDDIDELMSQVRPLQAEIYALAKRCRIAVQLWNSIPAGEAATIAATVAGFDVDSTIPNKTGLAGADAVTKQNVADNGMSYVTTVANLDTGAHLTNMLPFAGAANFN